jgi:hypothetical protein
MSSAFFRVFIDPPRCIGFAGAIGGYHTVVQDRCHASWWNAFRFRPSPPIKTLYLQGFYWSLGETFNEFFNDFSSRSLPPTARSRRRSTIERLPVSEKAL